MNLFSVKICVIREKQNNKNDKKRPIFKSITRRNCRKTAGLDDETSRKIFAVVEEFEYDDSENYGKKFAEFVLENGGKEMMEEIKKQIKE